MHCVTSIVLFNLWVALEDIISSSNLASLQFVFFMRMITGSLFSIYSLQSHKKSSLYYLQTFKWKQNDNDPAIFQLMDLQCFVISCDLWVCLLVVSSQWLFFTVGLPAIWLYGEIIVIRFYYHWCWTIIHVQYIHVQGIHAVSTRYVYTRPIVVQCWATVCDAVPTSNHHKHVKGTRSMPRVDWIDYAIYGCIAQLSAEPIQTRDLNTAWKVFQICSTILNYFSRQSSYYTQIHINQAQGEWISLRWSK